MQSVSENPSIATFQLSSAASLNLGRSQNGVIGNGIIYTYYMYNTDRLTYTKEHIKENDLQEGKNAI